MSLLSKPLDLKLGLSDIYNMYMRNMLLYLLIIGFVVFNTLFMLMYAISKIADHSIAVLCKDRDCTTCTENHRAITRLFRKYPYILIFDLIIIVAIALVYFFIKWMYLQRIAPPASNRRGSFFCNFTDKFTDKQIFARINISYKTGNSLKTKENRNLFYSVTGA